MEYRTAKSDELQTNRKVKNIRDVRQTEMETAELGPRAFEVEMTTEKLKSHKSHAIDQKPAELVEAGGRTIRFEIHKPIISIWSKKELSEHWKDSIIVPTCKKSEKIDCSNNGGIPILSTMYKILSNILLSRLTPHAEEIIMDYQCEF